MTELIHALGETLVGLERDIHTQGYDHGWAFWTVCPDPDHYGYHLHKQGGEEYRPESVQPFIDFVATQPFPHGLIGMIVSYEVTAPTTEGTVDGRVVMCALRDGYLIVVTRIADGKPRLELAPPKFTLRGPGAPAAEGLRTHVTNVERPVLPDGLRELLEHLPPGTQAFMLEMPEEGLQ